MSCYRGTIISTFLESREPKGILKCIIPTTDEYISPAEAGDDVMVVPVIYTSPYSWHNDGGLFAVPAPNTDILVQKVGNVYYYLASIVGYDGYLSEEVGQHTDERKITQFSFDRRSLPLYDDSTNFPNVVSFKHPKGHKLSMVDEAPKDGNVHCTKIEMRSATGKQVSLDDSNEVDAIRIGILNDSEDSWDGITIGHNIARLIGTRCIKVEADGSLTFTSHSSNITNTIVDGGSIYLQNTSSGKNRKNSPDFGNINLGTQFKDINLVTGDGHPEHEPVRNELGPSKIIIDQKGFGGVIRLNSDGKVEIFADSVDIKATQGDITLKSENGSVRVEAAQEFSAKTGGECIMKGSKVQLNPTSDPDEIPSTGTYTATTEELRGYVPFFWMLKPW